MANLEERELAEMDDARQWACCHWPEDAIREKYEALRYRLALEGLTPGGSEYVRDSERCVAHIRGRWDKQMRAMRAQARRRRHLHRMIEEMHEALWAWAQRWQINPDAILELDAEVLPFEASRLVERMRCPD